MKTKIVIFLSIAMIAFSCKTSKNNQKSVSPDTYRLIVSFISKGQGVDKTTFNAFESLIVTFNEKNNVKLVYDKYTWGKEGEFDCCFKMNDVKKGKQEDFVTAVKNVTKNSTSVIIKENEVCSHKSK